jgi:Na+/melibiose symporter-like transporter
MAVPGRQGISKGVNSWQMAAFAAPGLALGSIGLPLVIYLPAYYATVVGLSLPAIGSAFLLVRVLDLGFDPVVGALMDRTQTRWGRFRPWMAGGAPVLAFAVWALSSPPAHAGFLYLIGCLLLTYAAYSVCYLAQLAWGAALSSDYGLRSKIFSWWAGANLLGLTLVLALPLVLAGAGGDPSATVRAMAVFVTGALIVGGAIALLFAPEPRIVAGRAGGNLRDYLAILARPTVARLLAADLFYGTALGIDGAIFFFFFQSVKHLTAAQVTLVLFANMAGALSAAPVWGWLAGRIGRHRAAVVAFTGFAAFQVAIDLAPSAPIVLEMVVLYLAGTALSGGPILIRSMMADAGDEARLDEGVDRTGLLAALFSGTNKLGYAFAPAITFLVLPLFHFDARAAAQPGTALFGLRLLYVYLPLGLALACVLAMRGYRLTAAKHAEICGALALRDAVAAP